MREWLSSSRRWLEGKPRALAGAIVLMALALVASAGSTLWFAYDLTAGLPTKAQVRAPGRNGAVDHYSSTRTISPPSPSSRSSGSKSRSSGCRRTCIKAVVSVEDQRFYEHNGVDFIRVAAAVVRNLQEGRRAEGGSTITQQLARQTFLSRDKTYRRKLKEVILAAHIEREYPKDEILETLPEQGLFRRRPLRRRGGLARLLRQARERAHDRRSGAPRRADPVAVELRAHREPGSRDRPPERRAADDGRRPERSTAREYERRADRPVVPRPTASR